MAVNITMPWLRDNVPPPHLLHCAKAIEPSKEFTTPEEIADFLVRKAKKEVLEGLRAEYFYPSYLPVRWYKGESLKPQTAQGLFELIKKNIGYSEQTPTPNIPPKAVVPIQVCLESGLVRVDLVARVRSLTYQANFKSQTVYLDDHFSVFIHPDTMIIEVFAQNSFPTIVEYLKKKVFPKGLLTGFSQYITRKNDVLSSIKAQVDARKFKAWTESASQNYDKEAKEIAPTRDLDSISEYTRVYGPMKLFRAALSFDVQHADGYIERGVQFRYNNTKDEIAFSRNASRSAVIALRNAAISIAGTRNV